MQVGILVDEFAALRIALDKKELQKINDKVKKNYIDVAHYRMLHDVWKTQRLDGAIDTIQ